MTKSYNVKFFDSEGIYQSNLSDNARVSEISYTSKINSGQSQLVLEVSVDDFSLPPDYFDPFFFARVYQSDDGSNSLGRLIFSGTITNSAPFARSSDSGIRVTLIGLGHLLQNSLYKDGASFIVSHVSQVPKDIIEDIIDKFQAEYPPAIPTAKEPEWIGYNAVSGIRAGGQIQAGGTQVTFDFDKMTWMEAINKTLELAGGGMYWHIDKGGDVIFKDTPATATHTFKHGDGGNIEELSAPKNIETIINAVTVEYTSGSETASDATSISDYGKREKYFNEPDAQNSATAQQIADQKITDNKDPKLRARLVINSNYDIESIEPGDTCNVLNLHKDSAIFGNNMQIISMSYKENKVVLELEEKVSFGDTLEKFVKAQ